MAMMMVVVTPDEPSDCIGVRNLKRRIGDPGTGAEITPGLERALCRLGAVDRDFLARRQPDARHVEYLPRRCIGTGGWVIFEILHFGSVVIGVEQGRPVQE